MKIGCALVAFNRYVPSHVLLGKRTKTPGCGLWVLPGGKLDPGESPLECVKRESLEEVGLTLSNPTPVYHSWPGDLVMLYFTEIVDAISVELRAVHEFSELSWFDVRALPYNMWPSDVSAIGAACLVLGKN